MKRLNVDISGSCLPSPILTPTDCNANKRLKLIIAEPEQREIPLKLVQLLQWGLVNDNLTSTYCPKRVLGFGGSGVVIEAIEKTTDKIMAIKILPRNNTTPRDLNLKDIRNKNIVKLFGHFQDSRAHYLIMESFGTSWRLDSSSIPFVSDQSLNWTVADGGTSRTLFEFIECHFDSGIPLRSQKSLFSQIVYAVAYIHQKGIVHGDIKEENILVGKQNGRLVAKLCDFGHSIKVKKEPELQSYGTKLLSAPELLTMSDKRNVPPCFGYDQDIWALGLLFYTILTGSLPPENEGFCTQGKHVWSSEDVYPTDFNVIEDIDARNLSRSMLQMEPKSRPKAKMILLHKYFNQGK